MWNKIKDIMGINEEQYDQDRYDYEEYLPEQEGMEASNYSDNYEQIQPNFNQEMLENYSNNRRPEPKKSVEKMPKNNVIGMPGLTNGISEVVVIEPHTFEEMPQVIQALRERRSVILNLNVMNPEEAQRAVDFIAGGTFAMDGHQERVGESIFLFTPSCVKVSTLSGIIHNVTETPESRVRQTPNNVIDHWGESTAMAQ
ncbi:Cell division protein sepF [Stanieria cyanosphaera PCC 7437]|uniref:Cell division protein SepF n=1 Tax=Stanieria cyanosphaera (strain ATCC 29371 / PCC 7437) TaxID=111780 RepID=K9XTC8_STAC7|nr:cell division protein SepF [Stanieria cyanosphaera]AFZ35319.1 Cell division protein sepF [Stanieria cyanosphaera PCC 7437]